MIDDLIDRLLNEGKAMDEMLARPSDVDATLLALLQDRFYAERQMLTIREWLGRNLANQIDGLKQAHTAERQLLRDEVADLRRKLAEATALTVDAAPVDEITGHKRPRLHDVNDAVG